MVRALTNFNDGRELVHLHDIVATFLPFTSSHFIVKGRTKKVVNSTWIYIKQAEEKILSALEWERPLMHEGMF